MDRVHRGARCDGAGLSGRPGRRATLAVGGKPLLQVVPEDFLVALNGDSVGRRGTLTLEVITWLSEFLDGL